MVVIFLVLIVLRISQFYFVTDYDWWQLKWLLLGEWLDSGFMLYSETFDFTPPIAAIFYKILHQAFGKSIVAHFVCNSLLIIIQATYFNSIFIRSKAFEQNTYIPAFLYAVCMCGIVDFMTVSPQLLSQTFVLLIIQNTILKVDNYASDELMLSSGVIIGLAFLTYAPTIIFLPVFLYTVIFLCHNIGSKSSYLPIWFFFDRRTVYFLLLAYIPIFMVC